MNYKKSNIVKIDFNLTKGLILKWNFKGLLNPCYFRHIIVLDVGSEFKTSKFLKSYNDKIKLGEIYKYIYIDQKGELISKRWKQKSIFTQHKITNLKSVQPSFNSILELLNQIKNKNQQFTDPTIISLLTERSGVQILQLQQKCLQLITSKPNYTANIFCHSETCIDVSTGLNIMALEDFAQEKSWEFLRQYWSQIALLNMKITIQCQNGQLCPQNQELWRSIQFNRIERKLRMPTVNYEMDLIYFIHENFNDQVNYILNVKLQYEELSNKLYSAEKTISIKNMNGKVYARTFESLQKPIQVKVYEDIYSLKNPFFCESLVCFKKNFSKEVIDF